MTFAEISSLIGVTASTIGVFTAIPIIWTWYDIVWGRKKRHRDYLKNAANLAGNRPGILVVDLLPSRNIWQAINKFCQANEQLKNIPKDLIFKIDYFHLMSAKTMPDLARDLRKISSDALNHGVDVLHVFYAGPTIAATLIGAEFSNTCRVVLYHHNTNGNADAYENWGILKYEHIL